MQVQASKLIVLSLVLACHPQKALCAMSVPFIAVFLKRIMDPFPPLCPLHQSCAKTDESG